MARLPLNSGLSRYQRDGQWNDCSWPIGLIGCRSIWLPVEGKDSLDATAVKKLWEKIDANSSTYYASNAVAAEGYPLSDARSKPNVHKAVSNHIAGRAIDVSIPWKAGAKVFGKMISKGATSEGAANQIVRAFGLSRPVKSERWHFQLPADESRGFVSSNNLSVGGPLTEAGPQIKG